MPGEEAGAATVDLLLDGSAINRYIFPTMTFVLGAVCESYSVIVVDL